MAASSAEGAPAPRRPRRVVIVPGNGCSGNVRDANWYGWLEDTLKAEGHFDEVVLRNMPDPVMARESKWLPFLRGPCGCDAETIVVGHSSGAEAAMRLAETVPLFGIVLVSACWTDLGEESEAIAGYYNRPWEWEAILRNTQFVAQFHSTDDPFIPVSEAQHVADNLAGGADSSFSLLEGRSHFFEPFPELLAELRTRARGAAGGAAGGGAAAADAGGADAAGAAGSAASRCGSLVMMWHIKIWSLNHYQ